jgi:integrase
MLPEFMEAVRKLNGQTAHPQPARPTFSHLLAEYRSSVAYRQLAPATRKEYERYFKILEPMLGTFPVVQIKKRHMEQVMQKFSSKPAMAIAMKRAASVLFSYAAEKLEWIDADPLFRMESPRKRKQPGQRPYSEAEIRRFREATPLRARARLSFEIGLATAFRISDSGRVAAEDILSGMIALIINKVSELLVAPVTRQLREAYLAFRDRCAAEGKPVSNYALGDTNGSYGGTWVMPA